MSGAFACACSALGVRTMAESVGSISGIPARGPERHGKPSRYVGHGRPSRAERLEIISRIAAVGVSECSAWIVAILERSDVNEDPGME